MFIPRIKLYATVSSQMPFRLIRTHLPIKPAFAMTGNKAQGQTMELMGLYKSPQRQSKSLRGSLLNVNASSAGDACLHVQTTVSTVSMLH